MYILQAKEEQNSMELKYQNEITAHVKLSSLYKVKYTFAFDTNFKAVQMIYTFLFIHSFKFFSWYSL